MNYVHRIYFLFCINKKETFLFYSVIRIATRKRIYYTIFFEINLIFSLWGTRNPNQHTLFEINVSEKKNYTNYVSAICGDEEEFENQNKNKTAAKIEWKKLI